MAVTESEMVRGIWRDRSEAESTTLKEAIKKYGEEVSEGKKGVNQELCRIRRWLKNPPLQSLPGVAARQGLFTPFYPYQTSAVMPL